MGNRILRNETEPEKKLFKIWNISDIVVLYLIYLRTSLVYSKALNNKRHCLLASLNHLVSFFFPDGNLQI